MECKESKGTDTGRRGYGFNRDIVECKEAQPVLLAEDHPGFNRDIVECKDFPSDNSSVFIEF